MGGLEGHQPYIRIREEYEALNQSPPRSDLHVTYDDSNKFYCTKKAKRIVKLFNPFTPKI